MRMHRHGGHWLVQIAPERKSKNKRRNKSALKVKIWLCLDVRHIQLMMERLETVLTTSLDNPAIFHILISEPCLKLNWDTLSCWLNIMSVSLDTNSLQILWLLLTSMTSFWKSKFQETWGYQTRDTASPVITLDMQQRCVTLSCNISKGQKTADTVCLFF